jgi:hypothetical protein
MEFLKNPFKNWLTWQMQGRPFRVEQDGSIPPGGSPQLNIKRKSPEPVGFGTLNVVVQSQAVAGFGDALVAAA